jgi:D-arabinono-1,4-lactone oxidase
MTVRALVRALAGRGLAVASLPILLDQTVAGAVSNGSHGSSLHHGTLSDIVEGVTLVLPCGAVRRLSGAAGASQPTLPIPSMCPECSLNIP